MTELTILRVFTDARGDGGNPLGVVLDGAAVPPDERQGLACRLGFSETVFVDDLARGVIRIFTPAVELPFAGHPTVGTAWLLRAAGTPATTLRPPAGEVAVRWDGDVVYVAGRPEWVQPPYRLRQLPTAADVDRIPVPSPPELAHADAWAWEDEAAGRVRARVFPADLGILEDEATGSAAIQLAAHLGRRIEIRQGRGSRLIAGPLDGGRAEVGGTVAFVERRALDG